MDNFVISNTPPNSSAPGNGDGKLHQTSLGAHAVVNSIAGAADEAARKVQPAVDQAAAMAHRAVDRAEDAVAPTADWLVEQGESLNAAQKKLVTETCGYISANPLKAVGIAVAAGFLISRMIRS